MREWWVAGGTCTAAWLPFTGAPPPLCLRMQALRHERCHSQSVCPSTLARAEPFSALLVRKGPQICAQRSAKSRLSAPRLVALRDSVQLLDRAARSAHPGHGERESGVERDHRLPGAQRRRRRRRLTAWGASPRDCECAACRMSVAPVSYAGRTRMAHSTLRGDMITQSPGFALQGLERPGL
eukprot:92987-Prymnesium_polylepis.1